MLIVTGFSVPAAAQERSLEIGLFGTGNAPLQDLNNNPALGFKSGFGGGASVTYILEKNFAIRGEFNFVKSDVDVPVTGSTGTVGLPGSALRSQSWSHMLIGGDLVLRFPTEGGPIPYFTTGAGLVKFKESGGRNATRVAGRLGLGLQLPLGEKMGAFAQANAAAYDFDQRFFTYFTKVQVDVLFSAGVTFKVF